MNQSDLIQLGVYLVLLIGLTPLLGGYMAKVYTGEPFHGKKLGQWLEHGIYRLCGINSKVEMNWKEYAFAVMLFNLAGLLFLFLIQIYQMSLPFNPKGITNVNWALAFNTAVSFMTNTNWQSYAGETTLSPAVQMIGLTVQNFLSAGTGMAVLLVLIRGISRKETNELGNFWADMTRSVVYILLPLSFVLAVVLVSQGVIQTLRPNLEIVTLTGAKQIIPAGAVASQEAIKQLGTNGGGFFGVNSAHPFENPTPFSNFLEMLAILLIPASLTYTFGKMTGNLRQGWILFSAMFLMFIAGLALMLYSDYSSASALGTSALMEGKEVRFGMTNSVLWANATTCASNGSVNSMLSSFSPLAGMVAMLNMMLGEVIFGGAGSGLYGMLIFVILTVFIAGLMVGRTPEFMGKKIEAFDVEMAILAVLACNFVILVFTAISVMNPVALSSLSSSGPHGFSEILYAFTSAGANNGSAFAGLNANTTYYNVMLGIGMLIGRFGVILPVLAIAGNMAGKKRVPQSSGTLRTDTSLFVLLLIAVILIIGALTFFPALSLGPVIEHLLMLAGRTC
ncbi:MAG: potassium-transporting ATPase subunit KdpA [Bacteroidota bacterium]|nr:potassium-transporting ATPase subunit KdpA [Bacteroidota bacterium]